MAILTLTDIAHSYQKKGLFQPKQAPVLEHISLNIPVGQCFTLLGVSGAGKSTLGNIMLGIERPTRGTVTFLGQNLYEAKGATLKQLRRELQVVFQDSLSAVDPRMTAEQIIAEPLDNYQMVAQADKRAYITELLEQVGLSADDLTKYPRQFSGGQLQRINIARALALKPKLIVLDEPISSLDMVNQRLIIDLLQRLKEDFQLTYVFITHDIKAACLLSDHIAILEAGTITEQYTTVADFIASTKSAAHHLKTSLLAEHPMKRTIRSLP
ncbi:ATP-binding cassette domain-containing protein [Kurthia huakuii]|uniref:ATP-binding cassette domain-containing protein n=1 Tax=Kurthia huakuii TaxID=1421019 RepID=UPI000495DE61|nr:ATP-binding cassette domain-containing protein [Kurthia huakuii]MBM7698733.1 nickel transport system ATP-binding protein [Kurthia huakuii]